MIVNKAGRYGLYALVLMARDTTTRVTASVVAETFDISENHVAKVLQQLTRAGLVRGYRGVGGGYQLTRPADQITMLDVVETVDGPIPTSCDSCALRNSQHCSVAHAACSVHHVFSELYTQAYYTMQSITLATLAGESSLA